MAENQTFEQIHVRLATYNILADSYIRPEYYPTTPAALLDPPSRLKRLVVRIGALNADVLCLQEVEKPVFEVIAESLSALGYTGRYLPKRKNKPDGCATFVHGLEIKKWWDLAYQDDSGHVALMVSLLSHQGDTIEIGNSHLKWDPRGVPLEQRYGYRQSSALASQVRAPAVLCGDFNMTPDDEVIRLLRSRGLREAYDDTQPVETFAGNQKARKIDYILHSPELQATPDPLPRLDPSAPLPWESEPSDHLPLVACLELR